MDSYITISGESTAEYVEKRSRFIATAIHCTCEKDALEFIERQRSKYWDARHNCAAAVIGKNNEFTRCNDDGEPAGTAGKPMLEVLLGEGVHNVAVVVTRYFGGILLGTGGLVRAYQAAVKSGLAASKVAEKRQGVKMTLRTDYNGIGKIQYILGKHNIDTRDAEYGTGVVLRVVIEEAKVNAVLKEITEATNGQAIVHELDKVYFLEKN